MQWRDNEAWRGEITEYHQEIRMTVERGEMKRPPTRCHGAFFWVTVCLLGCGGSSATEPDSRLLEALLGTWSADVGSSTIELSIEAPIRQCSPIACADAIVRFESLEWGVVCSQTFGGQVPCRPPLSCNLTEILVLGSESVQATTMTATLSGQLGGPPDGGGDCSPLADWPQGQVVFQRIAS